MTERINLAELRKIGMRARCGGRSPQYQRDGEWTSFPADGVLALVEAVEATNHALSYMSYRPDSRWVPVADALARFDFGLGDA